MDPTDVRRLVDEVCEELAQRKARQRRRVSPLGVGLAVGVAGFAIACGSSTDLYGAPEDSAQAQDAGDTQETTPPVDLYGVQMDTADGGTSGDAVDTDVGGPVDLYGVMMDTVDSADGELPPPVDLYGVPVDAG